MAAEHRDKLSLLTDDVSACLFRLEQLENPMNSPMTLDDAVIVAELRDVAHELANVSMKITALATLIIRSRS